MEIKEKITGWLIGQIETAPKGLDLFYLEYDLSSGLNINLNLFGYKSFGPFNCEDPNALGRLSDWDWESDSYSLAVDERKVRLALESLAKENLFLLRERKCYFGLHESPVSPLFAEQKAKTSRYFYELHQESCSNDIRKYRVGDVDETPLLENDMIVQDLNSCDYALILQNRAKLSDLLYFYREWIVCTQKVVDLLLRYTDKIQIYNAKLFKDAKEKRPVAGYFIVILFEKIDCIPERYLLPPKWDNAPTTFDPSKGYKLIASVVQDKDVFRLNHEYYRLLVSQKFRDEWDRLNLSGASWLRREIDTEQ